MKSEINPAASNSVAESTNIAGQIAALVRQKSDKYQANDPGQYDLWNGHLKYVYYEATELAKRYGADPEIVQPSRQNL